MLAGPADLIAKGRLYRKRLGGGMRQAGVLAAAGLVALEETPQRAGRGSLQREVPRPKDWRAFPAFRSTPQAWPTNIVVFDVSGTGIAPAEISARLKQRGVLMNAINERQMRAVTHYDVDRAACAHALEAAGRSRCASRSRRSH